MAGQVDGLPARGERPLPRSKCVVAMAHEPKSLCVVVARCVDWQMRGFDRAGAHKYLGWLHRIVRLSTCRADCSEKALGAVPLPIIASTTRANSSACQRFHTSHHCCMPG